MWDMMGSDRSVMNLNKLFVKGASGALVVADITDRLSIESTAEWKQSVLDQIQGVLGSKDKRTFDSYEIPMLLILNKYDLVEELVEENYELEEYMTAKFLEEFSMEHGFIGSICTSAKTGNGVTEAVSALVRQVLENDLNLQESNYSNTIISKSMTTPNKVRESIRLNKKL